MKYLFPFFIALLFASAVFSQEIIQDAPTGLCAIFKTDGFTAIRIPYDWLKEPPFLYNLFGHL